MSGESLKFDNINYYALNLYIHALMFSRGVGVGGGGGGGGGQGGTCPPPPFIHYLQCIGMAIRLLKTQICVA